MSAKPTLSIILSAFNEEEFIKPAIESILGSYNYSEAAKFYSLEVLVIDDFSTDRTLEILNSFEDSRLKILNNKIKGKVHAYNLGLERSVGDFVILFAGDDLFNVDSIVQRLEPIREVAGPAVSFCALQAFRDNLENLAQRFPKFGGGARAGGAIAMNRAFVDLFWPIPTEMPNEDSWMCLHADYLETFVFDVDAIGMWYRLHNANTSAYGSSDSSAQRKALLLRSDVYLRFYLRWSEELTKEKRVQLLREISAHAMAASGNTLSILLMSGYPLMRRIRAACLSRELLWSWRVKLGAKVSGLVRA